MIPERIYLDGLLCYREAQEARFSGSSLWIIAGPNGSGKSALFDAVTYALYGYHRAGRTNSRSLIHRQRDSLVVEFDFRLGKQLYRARRTLDRAGRSTRQLFAAQLREARQERVAWEEIRGTHTEQGFRDWINQHVGLTYETFTSSVLLMQGRAENLLWSSPARRHDLLSRLVGLERYVELEGRVKQQCSRLSGTAVQLQKRLRAEPSCEKRIVRNQQRRVLKATSQLDSASAKVEQLRSARMQSQSGRQLLARINTVQRQLDEMQSQRVDSVSLLRSYQRWTLLEACHESLASYLENHNKTTSLGQILRDLKHENNELQKSLDQIDRRRKRVGEALQHAEVRLDSCTDELQKLAERENTARSKLMRVKERTEICIGLQKATEGLRGMTRKLNDLRMARVELVRQLPAERKLRATKAQLDEAIERHARSRADFKQADDQMTRFQQVDGEKTCRFCRQPLPASHVAQQKQQLEQQCADARRRYECANRHLASVQNRATRQVSERAGIEQRLLQLDIQIAQVETAQCDANDRQQQLLARCSLLENRAGELDDNRLAEITIDLNERTASLEQQLADAEQTCRSLDAERQVMNTSLPRYRQEVRSLRAELISLADKRDNLFARHATVTRQLDRASQQLQDAEQAIAQALQKLPQEWQPARSDAAIRSIDLLWREWRELTKQQVAQQWQVHQSREEETERLQLRLDALREDYRASAPETPDSQSAAVILCDDEEIASQIQAASHERQACEEKLRNVSVELAKLQEAKDRRERLERELMENERQQHLYQRLSRLLGRDGLQCYLLGNAETAIVQMANHILERLVGGTVHLERIEDERTKKAALNLQARTTTADGMPQPIAFLSGSQRFRVAVALSLALGQYASRHRRPVQAVIIDEGFGCLDTVNRQLMIQELQNLCQHLDRILLVSHQDEFISAFPDGYRCELVEGSTRLREFHR